MDPATSQVDELKRLGNQAFVEKDYGKAEEIYNKAISLEPQLHVRNRVVSSGNQALTEPGYVCESLGSSLPPGKLRRGFRGRKQECGIVSYMGQSTAHEGLGQYRLAHQAFEQSVRLDTSSGSKVNTLRRIATLKKLADKIDAETPIQEKAQWMTVYSNISDPRMRLAVFVYFWNRSTRPTRFAAFMRLLQILASGGKVPNISNYSEDQMLQLPTENYQDLALPETWTAFYDRHEMKGKLDLFEAMYRSSSETEQTLIVNDMKKFLLGANH